MTNAGQMVAGAMVVVGAVMGATAGVQALEISVRGESELVAQVKAAGTTVITEGRLVDDVGEALPGRPVEISIDGPTGDDEVEMLTYTDFFGQFSAVSELPAGDYDVEVVYPGSEQVSGASTRESLEIVEAPVQLSVEAPSWIHGEPPEAPLEVTARANERGLPTFATISIDDRSVASVELDRRGHASFELGPYLEPGYNEVIVEVEATDYRAGATQSTSVRRLEHPQVTGGVDRVFERMRRGIEAEVTIEDDEGPLEGAEVVFEFSKLDDGDGDSSDDPATMVMESTTGVDGRASVIASDDELGDSAWEVGAKAKPDHGRALVWEGQTLFQTSPPWRRFVVLVAALVLVAGLGWLGRRAALAAWGRIQHLWGRWAAGEHEDEDIDDEPQIEPDFEAVEEVKLETHRGGDDDTQGRRRLRLWLWDQWREEPVEDGVVEIVDAEGQVRQLEVGDGGPLTLELDDSRPWTICARAPGYVTAEATVDDDVAGGRRKMVLTPVPIKIRRAYRRMVSRVRGDDPWGRLTPRQIETALKRLSSRGDHQRGSSQEPDRRWRRRFAQWEQDNEQKRVDALIEAVTAAVEETNFSGRRYDTAIWEATCEVLEQLGEFLRDTAPEDGDG